MILRRLFPALIIAGLLAPSPCFAAQAHAQTAAQATKEIEFGRFGAVKVFSPQGKTKDLVVFVSDRAWSDADDKLAAALVATGRTVLGVDGARYMATIDAQPDGQMCLNGDFEQLVRNVERTLDFTEYHQAYLTGLGSGAFIAWAAIGTALPNTFNAGVGVGFTPVEPLKKQICLPFDMQGDKRLYKGWPNKETPWIYTPAAGFEGETRAAFQQQNADATVLPATEDAQQAILDGIKVTEAYNARENSMGDIPTIEIPPVDGVRKDRPLVVLYSGDGGWRDIDRQLGGFLSQEGFFVVGVDVLRYFWKEKKPEAVATDFQRILNRYRNVWAKKGVIVIGYSMGGEMLPAMLNRVPEHVREDVKLVTMLGPGPFADFQIFMTGYLGMQSGHGKPILPEITKLDDIYFQCFYGADEKDKTVCTQKDAPIDERIEMPGGHHLGFKYREIADQIIATAKKLGAR
ncbi:MAG: virulence factor family protein [Rhodospirillales bacterium]|nr:virulence factor family protein [Rhodospirillales bacterium]